jgi:hypothetical protein
MGKSRKGLNYIIPNDFAWHDPGSMQQSVSSQIQEETLMNTPKVGRSKAAKARKELLSHRCNQCEAAVINGVFCHENGCPNTRKTYIADRDQWVLFVECRECGCEIEAGEQCSCFEEVQ